MKIYTPVFIVITALCVSLALPDLFTIPHELRSGAALSFDVPFVPTREEVVREMLRLAEPTSDDILYDLGCGDGRIVIEAAKNFGLKGVGIDIDPERIAESRNNAEKAGVTDKVRFINGNLYDADFKEATIMTLYLLPHVNLSLRPRLFTQLRPGTKVVSHDFDMAEWKADRSVAVPGRPDMIYYWVVPANAGGVWEWKNSKGLKNLTLRLSQSFQKVKGTLTRGSTTFPLSDATLIGDRLAFTVKERVDGRPALIKFEGRVKGNIMEGSTDRERWGGPQWKAERDPSTVAPIDK